jgi:hypothetical protein
LKVKVNQNEFKKNIGLKYQLQVLKQQNQEKFNKLSQQFYQINNLKNNKYTRQSSLPINIESKSRNYANYYFLNTNQNIGKSIGNLEKVNNKLLKNISFERKTMKNDELSIKSKNNLNKEYFQFMNQQEDINNNEIIMEHKYKLNENDSKINKKVNFSPKCLKKNNVLVKSFNNSFLDNYAESYKKQYLNTSSNNRKDSNFSNDHLENENNLNQSNNLSAVNADYNTKDVNHPQASRENGCKIDIINYLNKKTENSKSNFKKINIYDKFLEKKSKEFDNIKTHSGPIDNSFLIQDQNLNLIIERLIQYMMLQKISNVKLSKFKYLCSHDNLNFDVTLFKLDKEYENFYYLKMNMNKPIKLNQNLTADNKQKLKTIHNNSVEFKNICKGLISFINNGVI